MRKNKSVIVLISIILILVIVGGVFAYLYLTTDIFKSDKELFAKYFAQNEIIFQDLTDLKVIKTFENLKNENKYEINTDVEMGYSEGGEISNALNDLALKLDIQRNQDNQYSYINGQLLYDDEEYIQTELIKEKNIYGVRFTDAFQQFITLEKDENFNAILNDIGLTDDQIQKIMQLFDNQTNNYNEEQIQLLDNKYINLIKKKIENGEFLKQKDVNVSYNENNINANTYTVFINSEQIQNMLIEILNNIKNEEILVQNIEEQYEYFANKIDEVIEYISEEIEIPSIKVTVYEYKQNLIKTVLEIGTDDIITIENIKQNEGIQMKISYLGENSVLPQVEITINKTNNEIEEKTEINANLLINEENILITLSNLIELSPQIKSNTEIGYRQGIKVITLKIQNDINLGENINENEVLEEQNTKSLNSIKSENRKEVIDKLKNLIMSKMSERVELLIKKMGILNNEDDNSEPILTQTEINKFNAKFEFYTGEDVSSENVKTLLEIVKNNMNSYENLNEENSEETNKSETKNSKLNIKINIEKDKENQDDINEILEKIKSNKKYKISIKYSEENGLIESITMTEV